MDSLTKEKRSWNMSRVKSKNTRPEIIFRKALFALGYRYKLHDKKLSGTPDLVFKKYRTVVFVHGCFWHRHKNCAGASIPKTNVSFWREKFQSNVMHFARAKRQLNAAGWKVVTVWECWIEKRLSETVCRVSHLFKG